MSGGMQAVQSQRRLLIGQNPFLAQLSDHQRELHIDARDHLLQVVHAALQQFNLTRLRFRRGDASFKLVRLIFHGRSPQGNYALPTVFASKLR